MARTCGRVAEKLYPPFEFLSFELLRKRADVLVDRLQVRRVKACEGFVKKTLVNENLCGWYKERPRTEKEYRIYEEQLARTDRRWNLPLFYYRRVANRLQLTRGQPRQHQSPPAEAEYPCWLCYMSMDMLIIIDIPASRNI